MPPAEASTLAIAEPPVLDEIVEVPLATPVTLMTPEDALVMLPVKVSVSVSLTVPVEVAVTLPLNTPPITEMPASLVLMTTEAVPVVLRLVAVPLAVP